MTNQDNQYSIYLRSTKQRITCTKQQFDDYYREIDNFRRKQQRHGRCICLPSKQLMCDMDCYHYNAKKMQRASWEQSRGAFLMPGWR